MDNNLLRQQVYLAALLHDIGKFYQRADENLFKDRKKNEDNEIEEVSYNLAQSICPPNKKGGFGYHHVIWTSQFFENAEVKKVLQNISGLRPNIWKRDNEDSVINLACNHHRPYSLLQKVIRMADWWSAGIDRTHPETFEKDNFENEKIKWGYARHKKIPLNSIFNQLHNHHGCFAHRLHGLSINNENDIFPHHVETSDDGVSQSEYRKLWGGFITEFRQLPSDSFEGFSESLLFLLKKYTWCIPSNTNDMADVSLFDHLKTTAAFALCFTDYLIFHSKLDSAELNFENDEYPVLFLGCDISGIQNFIYNISSSKAAVSLKGRSFYLQLLVDSIIQKIISHPDIQANPANVIYSSGGKFYMILPNLPHIIKAIEGDIIPDIEKELWSEHKNTISVNIDYLPFSYQKNQISCQSNDVKSIGQLWKSLNDKLTISKSRKFQSIIQNDDSFFEVNQTGGNVVTCAVSGENLQDGEIVNLENGKDILVQQVQNDEEIVPVSRAVYEQKQLGVSLKDADYLIVFRGNKDESSYLNNYAHSHKKLVGVDNYLFDQYEITLDNAEFRKITSADVSRVIRFNQTKPFIVPLKGNKVSYGYQFYGGNQQACFRDENDNPVIQKHVSGNKTFHIKKAKTFEELTQIIPGSEHSETYLGILKMDVDNMGHLFIHGFPEKSKSFSAYSTLSFYLDLFFSGYLNHIRNHFKDTSDSFKYRDWVNILYSGGDDIFAIGRWDKIIEFAADINREFIRFTGRNDITLSAGIAIVNNKFPLSKAANIADDAEKKSKNFPNDAPQSEKRKNAITFFNETISWSKEYDYVKSYKDKFCSLIENEGMSRGILHKMMQFSDFKKQNDLYDKKHNQNERDLSYKWHAAYYLKRYLQQYKNNKSIPQFIRDLQKELFASQARNYNMIGLAARWAEQQLRINNILNKLN